MKIVFTKHVYDKIELLKERGWIITETKIKNAIKKPRWRGVSRHGQATAMVLADKNHVLRVIFNKESDTIKVVTIHITRRGRYESTI